MDPNSQHQLWSRWNISVRVEGKPAHDPAYQTYVRHAVAKFFREKFGSTAEMKMEVFIEAGDVQDGKPPAQLLMMPWVESKGTVWGAP